MTNKHEWKSVSFIRQSRSLHYGRFMLSSLKEGQANILGTTIRRVLLAEIKGTRITHATFQLKEKQEKSFHQYSTIPGIRESVHEILENLKTIVLKSPTNQVIKASISISESGPMLFTAKNINLPDFVHIVNEDQPIAYITGPIDLSIELILERDRGYHPRHLDTASKIRNNRGINGFESRSFNGNVKRSVVNDNVKYGDYSDENCSFTFPIDSTFTPVLQVNYTYHANKQYYDPLKKKIDSEEILFLEICTNGSLTPAEALREACLHLIDFFQILPLL
nr:RNA polymerase alpha subunit [Carex laevissima]UHY39472.1 RNA polymerase alpha subunit [Carex laevissima]